MSIMAYIPTIHKYESLLMSLHIIIDGYNLIHQSKTFYSPDNNNLQMSRDILIDILADYKKIKHHKITVVFDGTCSESFYNCNDIIKGIRIIFSRKGELADAVIKKIATKEKEKAIVVSSDREVVDYSNSKGAAVINSSEFDKIITIAANLGIDTTSNEREDNTGWVPTTKKKGPRKRLSKKHRFIKKKIRKL